MNRRRYTTLAALAVAGMAALLLGKRSDEEDSSSSGDGPDLGLPEGTEPPGPEVTEPSGLDGADTDATEQSTSSVEDRIQEILDAIVGVEPTPETEPLDASTIYGWLSVAEADPLADADVWDGLTSADIDAAEIIDTYGDLAAIVASRLIDAGIAPTKAVQVGVAVSRV